MDAQKTTRNVTVKFCAMCDKPVSGKAKYCSAACRQAAHRARRGVEVHERQQGQEVAAPSVTFSVAAIRPKADPNRPLCARHGCDNPTAEGKRARWLTYCSESCKQKAKRQRWLDARRAYNYAGR